MSTSYKKPEVFTDETFTSMAGNPFLCCLPMTEYRAVYKETLFVAASGCWWVNGIPYDVIDQVRDAINNLLEHQRLLRLPAVPDPFVIESQPE